MADNLRKQIRDEAASLIGSGTAVGDRIYPGRIWPLGAANLPCITIHTPGETASVSNLKRDGDHVLDLVVTIWAKDSVAEGVNDALDRIASDVHGAILSTARLGSLKVLAADYAGSKLDQGTLGETACGVLSLTYTVRYRTSRGVADQFI